MRGEVRLLNRNVRVVGNNDSGENWGCNILTLDRTEFDGTVRQSTTKFDNVEVTQCSQENTFKAAIRFENTGETAASYVKNSVVHNSQAWSLYIANSKNILVQNSDFIGSKAVGVNLKSITDVTVDGIFTADVVSRVNEAGDKFVDREACVAYCSYFEPDTGCSGSKVINSISAGCPYTGFTAPGHACDDYTTETFKNNVAHSGERTGAHIYPDPSDPNSSNCYEGSYFKAYKNRDGGLTTLYTTLDQRMRYMTFFDNQLGMTLQSAGERDELYISMRDIVIYGESDVDNLDAPGQQDPYCPDKTGLQLFGANRDDKKLHPTSASSFPIHKMKSYAIWGGTITLTDVTFSGFAGTTVGGCDRRSVAITRNNFAADYIPIHSFVNTEFINVNENGVAFIRDPNPGWANPTDCIEWPCTPPENVVIKFTGASFSGADHPD